MNDFFSDLEALICTRRSVREFLPAKVPDVLIEKLIYLASYAPSASNRQAWRFLVSQDSARLHAMAELVNEDSCAYLDPLDIEAQAAFQAYRQHFASFARAPALIVPIFRKISTALPEALSATKAQRAEELSTEAGLISVALAMQNIVLAAHALGLATCVMTGPLLAADKLHAFLAIPAGWQIAAFIPLGYANETPKTPPRKPVDQLIIPF